MEHLKPFLSRKFILAVASALIVFLNKAFDLKIDDTQVLLIVSTFIAFIGVEGAKDYKNNAK